MSGKELPKIIDKSQADIDAAIEAIKTSTSLLEQKNLPYPVLS
jgi:hypothetical protein